MTHVLMFAFSQDDPMTNLNTAFDVAEKYLDIPKMLDAEGKTFRGQFLFHCETRLDLSKYRAVGGTQVCV